MPNDPRPTRPLAGRLAMATDAAPTRSRVHQCLHIAVFAVPERAMRWIIRLSLVVFVAWVAFVLSPFLALHDLQQAVEARDAHALSERINFRALRLSLT